MQPPADRLTKRALCALVASLYGPFGPVVVLPKLILQQAHKAHLPWDADISDLEDATRAALAHLLLLDHISVEGRLLRLL